MISSRIQQRALSLTQPRNGRPVGLLVAAGVGALLFILCVWVAATMNTPPATTQVKAEVSVKL